MSKNYPISKRKLTPLYPHFNRILIPLVVVQIPLPKIIG
jgi:hypothetical protein